MSRMPRPNRRSRMSCSAIALATVMVAGASPAAAQSFQGEGVFTHGSGSIATPDSITTNISVTSGQAVIDWAPFADEGLPGTNIVFQAGGTTATFSSEGNFAVLNRINPADSSRAIGMDGVINSFINDQTGGSIYFYSPSGFILGATSAINVGSLVLSASPLQLDGNGNFINGTSVIFNQALNPAAKVIAMPGSTINALNQSSYVAMVAPRVQHHGTVAVNGSAALVGAEAATINFSPDGLFDIQVTVGTTDGSGVAIHGDIGGPASSGEVDHHRVYAVAVPKNDALTMVIGAGSDLGFTLAGSASIDDMGAVVLSAGHDISDGSIGSESAAAVGVAHITFNGAHSTSNLFSRTSGATQIFSNAEQATVFDSDLTAHSDQHIRLSTLDGGTLTFGGDVSLLAGTFIEGENISTPGSIFARTLTGDIDVGSLTSTLGSIELVAGGNIVAGNIAAAQAINLAAPGTMTTEDINAGGIFRALGHGDMSFGDAIAGEVFLADFAMLVLNGDGTATCVGNCGTLGADGVVIAPPSGSTYFYVTTAAGGLGDGQIPGEGGTNGSLYTTSVFSAAAGDDLNFWFNYVTSDGAGFSDYAWAALYTAGLDPVAMLFTARTRETGTIVPGFDLPGVEATLTPATVPIIGGPPVWSPLGGSSNSCYAAGCGFTGWINSTYDIADAGNYVVRFGVSNYLDTGFDSGLAFSGITVGGNPVEAGLIRTDGSILIGNVETGKFTAAAGTSLTTGIIDSSGPISLDAGGAIMTGDLTTSFPLIELVDGGIGTQSHSGGPSIEIFSDTSVLTGHLDSAEDIIIDSGGSIETGNAEAVGFIEMFADGGIETLDLTAGLDIDLEAGGDLTFNDVDAGTEFDFDAEGAVSGQTILAGVTVEGHGDGAVVLGNITVGAGVEEDDTFSVGITSETSILVGNVQGPRRIGFATLGDLTTGSLTSGWDVMLLVGGDVVTGAITSGEGDQVFIADASMCEIGGSCDAQNEDETDDFDPELVLAEDPVATGGSITIDGPVSTSLFRASAGNDFAAGPISAIDDIEVFAGGTATVGGEWSAGDVYIASNDIDIGVDGSIEAGDLNLVSINETRTIVGDGIELAGYHLSDAEYGRLGANDINVIADTAFGAAPTMLIGDLSINASGEGGIEYDFTTGNSEAEIGEGSIRIVGEMAFTGMGDDDFVDFTTEAFELDAETGLLSLTSDGTNLAGNVEIYAAHVHVASGDILDQLAVDPQYAGYQDDLNAPAEVQRPDGVIRAAIINLEFGDAGGNELFTLFVQNTGTAQTPAGFVVTDQVFFGEDGETVLPAGSLDLIINGQIQTEGGTLTGIDVRDALVADQEDLTPFTDNSTINGCQLSGPCGGTVLPPGVEIVDSLIELINSDMLGETGFGFDAQLDDFAADDSADSHPIRAPSPLFDARPLVPSSEVDDPISGTGNPSFVGSGGDEDEEEEEEEEKAPETGNEEQKKGEGQ